MKNEKQIIENQENPYAEFEPAFDILPLPSKGLFYPKINEKPVDTVKVYYLTAEDESIMMSPNLIQNGQMINVLLRKKVQSDYPVDKMLVGDRLAILIYLRTTMEQFYKVQLEDPNTGLPFEYDIDLSQMVMKDMEHLPNQEGCFDFKLPKSGRRVTFRLMTGEDEVIIKAREKQEQNLRKNNESMGRVFKFEQLIVGIEGINPQDKLAMSQFIKNMPIMDSRKLSKYIDDVTPTIDLEIEVPTPSGGNFRTYLPITTEFLYPAI